MQQLDTTVDGSGRPISPSPWYTTEQAAIYIGCRPGTLKTWRALGRGPRYYVVNQKLVRYSQIFLDEFVRGENLDAPRHLASVR